MKSQNEIYQESTQNIPLFQRMNNLKSNVISRFYNYTKSECPIPRLYPTKPILFLGTIINPHIEKQQTNDFKNVITTHMNAYESFSSLLYFIYRKDFPVIPNTSLTTDCGWGCAIRSTQMLVANAFIKINGNDKITMRKTIQFFLDFYHVKCPYSIHSFFTTQSILQSSVNGNSYLPITVCCSAITELINRDIDNPIGCYMVSESIELETISKPTIIFLPYSIPDKFSDHLQVIFSMEWFCGMIAGAKQKAFYFFGMHEDQLLLLDPHIVKSHVQFVESFEEKQFIAQLSDVKSLKLKDLESFVTFAFCVQNTQQLLDLKQFIKDVLGIYKKDTQLRQKEECNGFEVLEF